MRLLVTGASGLLGSNVAAAAAQQSWSALGTYHTTPVSLLGARTAALDLGDRHACVTLAETLSPDVVVHAAGTDTFGMEHTLAAGTDTHGLEHTLAAGTDTHGVEHTLAGGADTRDVEHTLAAARAVRAQYVLVSCELVYSGALPSAERWDEEDPAAPTTALGRALLARERLVQGYPGRWLIVRPADVYGVNLALPAPTGDPEARARHVWERSGAPLEWVRTLRAGRLLLAPAGVRRTPTYAWDFAQRLCELIAQECDGVFNMPGPTILGRLAYMRLLARAFDCEMELVRDGGDSESAPRLAPPANTALSDRKATFLLGHPAVDPFNGVRLMRRQLERLLGGADPPHRKKMDANQPAPELVGVQKVGAQPHAPTSRAARGDLR